jgi:ribosomal protein S27AE
MVTPPTDSVMFDAWPALEGNGLPLGDQRQVARRPGSRQCPDCGIVTVRSRDRREMCLICGYLQLQA